ncbi:MAG: ABC transporter ATP-binding protein [Actinobacteria bacterium]|jgi:ABC-2 type transport system ATP-binding protein|nr:MAG: ABC transporter ATP-binding protein [Actinomycetota bacterium]
MNEGASGYMIEAHGLVKRYGKFTAVDHLDLQVNKGEIYGLLGPNGAGKTTTIKVLCGLLKLSGGEAYVNGKPIPDRRIAAQIGYMPQETALYLGLTVHQNMAFFGEIFGLTKREIGERERDLLEFINLSGWRDEMVGNLSGGMKHRVSLACALIHMPPLLLLDEPTVGVDPELRVSFWDYFNDIKSQGRTIVITTHYMDEAGHCDRIGFMHNGLLIAEGEPGELLVMTGTDNLEDAFMSFSASDRKGAEQ